MSAEEAIFDNSCQNSSFEGIVPTSSSPLIYVNGDQVRGDETIVVSSGQVVSGAIVSSDVRMIVSSGGTVALTSVNSSGHLLVYGGGMANDITLNSSGYMEIENGGIASRITVNENTVLHVEKQGTALEIVENGGCVWDNGFLLQSSPSVSYTSNVFSGLAFSSFLTTATVHSGTTALSTTIDSGCLFIYSGGTAQNTIAGIGARIEVYSGGTALEIVENGGYVGVDNDTYVTFLPNVFSGLQVSDEVLSEEACVTVHSGTTAVSTTLSGYCYMQVYCGGIASKTIVDSGTLWVYDSGLADGVIVKSNGELWVESGGTAMDIVENGGNVSVDSGASVSFIPNTFSGLLLSEYSTATVHSGTTAISTTVNSGGVFEVFSGGTALEIVENGGNVSVDSGTSVSFIPNTFSGLSLSAYSTATVHSGTTAVSTIVNFSGCFHVYGDGIAQSTTVNSRTIKNRKNHKYWT